MTKEITTQDKLKSAYQLFNYAETVEEIDKAIKLINKYEKEVNSNGEHN